MAFRIMTMTPFVLYFAVHHINTITVLQMRRGSADWPLHEKGKGLQSATLSGGSGFVIYNLRLIFAESQRNGRHSNTVRQYHGLPSFSRNVRNKNITQVIALELNNPDEATAKSVSRSNLMKTLRNCTVYRFLIFLGKQFTGSKSAVITTLREKKVHIARSSRQYHTLDFLNDILPHIHLHFQLFLFCLHVGLH